jgi:hypothetical protein
LVVLPAHLEPIFRSYKRCKLPNCQQTYDSSPSKAFPAHHIHSPGLISSIQAYSFIQGTYIYYSYISYKKNPIPIAPQGAPT